MSHNHVGPSAASIVAHYRAKGYRKAELRRAVARHVRLLRPLDPEVADSLESAQLVHSATEWRKADALRHVRYRLRKRYGAVGASRSERAAVD